MPMMEVKTQIGTISIFQLRGVWDISVLDQQFETKGCYGYMTPYI